MVDALATHSSGLTSVIASTAQSSQGPQAPQAPPAHQEAEAPGGQQGERELMVEELVDQKAEADERLEDHRENSVGNQEGQIVDAETIRDLADTQRRGDENREKLKRTSGTSYHQFSLLYNMHIYF